MPSPDSYRCGSCFDCLRAEGVTRRVPDSLGRARDEADGRYERTEEGGRGQLVAAILAPYKYRGCLDILPRG